MTGIRDRSNRYPSGWNGFGWPGSVSGPGAKGVVSSAAVAYPSVFSLLRGLTTSDTLGLSHRQGLRAISSPLNLATRS